MRRTLALLLWTLSTPALTAAPGDEGAPPTRALHRPDAPAVGTLPEGVGRPVGEVVPDVVMRDIDGGERKLSEQAAVGHTLVIFYRGGWCPYCNTQIYELAGAWPRFQALGVTPVLVSVDRVDEAARTQALWEIPFPVISDPELAVHEAFDVVYTAGKGEVRMLKRFGIDIEAASGQTHHAFAVPAMFLLDAERRVLWGHADADYKVRPSPDQLLAAIGPVLAR